MGKNTQTVTDNTTDAEVVDALMDDLDDLDFIEEPEAEPVAEAGEVTDDNLTEEDLDAVEQQIEREEVYAGQESTVDTDTDVKTAKTKAAKKKAQTSSPRVSRDIESIDSAFFVLEGDAAKMSQADLNSNKADVIASKPTQKKIAEKFDNLFGAISVSKAPSVYVMKAFKLLDSKTTVTSKDIVEMLKADYSQGTAQSQAGQIMTLFAATRIATRTGNSLTINSNSNIAGILRGL